MRLSRLAVMTSRTSSSRCRTSWLVCPRHEAQVGPAAVDGVAVHDAIAVEPVEVLVEDGLAQLFQRLRVAFRCRLAAEEAPVDDLRHALDCPRSLRWMPLIVRAASRPWRYSCAGRMERSTKGTLCCLGDFAMPRCRARAACCSPCRRARLRSFRSSWAIGEKRTSRGAVLPLYFWASVCLMKLARSCLNSRALPRPRTIRCSRRRRRSRRPWCMVSQWSGVPKFGERRRRVSSSPEKPRSRMDQLVFRETGSEGRFRASRHAACGRRAYCR